MNNLFVFDLDDTLMDNVHDYSESILNMCRVIIEELKSAAPHVSIIVALEDEIDLRRRFQTNPKTGKQYGYSMDRFLGTMVETYREICERIGIKADPTTESRLYYIGMNAFKIDRYERNIKPNTKEVVDFLDSQGDLLLIYTAGDERVQEKKMSVLSEAGINFSFVEITDKKNYMFFAQLAEKHPGKALYSVGNNYMSDIAPAISAGFRGIYIPVETWETIGKMGQIRSEINWERCIELRSLIEIKEKYTELDAKGGE